LKLGTYGVFAINEAEGYSIENQSPGQDVTVSSDQPWPSVTVRLHGRGGVLVGSITDKLTGRSIRGSIQYMAVDMDCDSAASTLVEGKFNVTITPNCDVVVIAKAKGYKGWVFTDGARPTLRLARGERKEINIQLEPSPTNSASE